jgi:hypothetical protein
MVRQLVISVVVVVAVFGGTFGLLATVFRLQVRGYDRRVATDLLDDWTARLELLDPRQRAAVVPPANVLEAVAALPAPGWRTQWNDAPTRVER